MQTGKRFHAYTTTSRTKFACRTADRWDNADQNASLFLKIRLAAEVKITQKMIRRAGNRHNNDRAVEDQSLRGEGNKIRSQKQLLQSSEKEEQIKEEQIKEEHPLARLENTTIAFAEWQGRSFASPHDNRSQV